MSPQVSLKTKSAVTLVAFEEKTFLVSPQVSFKTKYQVTLVAFEEEKRFFGYLSSPQKCNRSYIGHRLQKNLPMSVVTASQVNKIGFISLLVCFDLLDPKSSLSARQLKKGAGAE